jgi:hypothetical protein
MYCLTDLGMRTTDHRKHSDVSHALEMLPRRTLLAAWLLQAFLFGCGSSDSHSSEPVTDRPIDGGTDVFNPIGSPEGGPGSCDNPIDLEGCPCSPGEPARPCYPGPFAQAGVGPCTMGTQACVATGEGEFRTGTWGTCAGAGKPSTCEAAGVTCGTVLDGCGGQVTCGAPCPACEPGSQVFSTPGSFDFVVPEFETLEVELWGGGGGATAYAQVDVPTPGGDSSFNAVVVAGGGAAASDGAAAPGGKAFGGAVNLDGGAGSLACAQYLNPCTGYVTRVGGDSPKGGTGGKAIIELDACSAYMFGSTAGDGENGQTPGGGGGGDQTCQFNWLAQQGWGMGGAGAGAGAYASTTYTKSQLSPGSTVSVVVGAGGRGSKGAMSSQVPGTNGKNPGHYTGGDGARGEVRLSWTCAPQP